MGVCIDQPGQQGMVVESHARAVWPMLDGRADRQYRADATITYCDRMALVYGVVRLHRDDPARLDDQIGAELFGVLLNGGQD